MINEKKAELRRSFAELDSMFDAVTRAATNSEMRRQLASVAELGSAATVFCYVSNEREPDTRELLRALLAHGRSVCVPRTAPGGVMDAVRITSLDELRPSSRGLLEPPDDYPAVPQWEIDFAVIPGAAFDLAGNRLGRGGGYYDRWLANYSGVKCGLCTELTLTGHLPHEPHDVKMDIIVTERRVLRAEDMTADLPQLDEEHTAQAELEDEDDAPPRRRYGAVRAIIYFLTVIGVSAALATFGWLCADDLLALTRNDFDKTIVITESDSVGDVGNKLKEAGLIKYPWLFNLFGTITGAEEKIDAGTYNLNATFDYQALIRYMRTGSSARATVTVSFPEGFTMNQILLRMEAEGVASYAELYNACISHDFEYTFLEELPLGMENRLEGYLFPDTYTFYVDDEPTSVINKLLYNYSRKFLPEYVERAEELGITTREALIIASLIEKEAAKASEMSTISSVMWNRMNSQSLRKLQMDASIQYILPERKARLSLDDIAIDSPYNTYMYEGLPPGPICNPGSSAIKAALYPKTTQYYYYALTDDGVHEFAKTYEEQQRIIAANPETYPNSN